METALLKEIRKFLRQSKMGKSYFGRVATGNSELVSRLEEGKTVTLRTAEKARRFMDARRGGG